MAKQNVTLYNIMIGTCSDLDAIGLDTRIVNAVMQWNQANQKGCVCLMPRHWKISSAPSSGKKPQEIINEQITNQCDALVVFLWTRVGKGVEEEIQRYMDADKPVLLYFYEGEVAFEHMNNTKMSGIKRFKKKYADKMLFSPKAIHSPEEIEGKLLMGLNFCLDRLKNINLRYIEEGLTREFTVNDSEEVSVVDFTFSQYESRNFTVANSNRTFVWEVPEAYVQPLTDKLFLQNDNPVAAQRAYSKVKTSDPEMTAKLYTFLHENFGNLDIDSLLKDCARKAAEFFLAKDGTNNFNGSVLGVYHMSRNRTVVGEFPIISLKLYTSDYFTFRFMSILYQELRRYNSRVFVVRTPEDVNRLVPFFNSIGIGGFVCFNRGEGMEFLFSCRGKGIACEGQWHFTYDETFSLMDQSRLEKVWTFDYNRCLMRGLREEIGVDTGSSALINNSINGFTDIMVIANGERFEFEICGYVYIGFSETYTYQELIEKYKIAPDANWESSAMVPVNISDIERFIGSRNMTPESRVLIKRLKSRIKVGSLSF